jgi:hypothetical protein
MEGFAQLEVDSYEVTDAAESPNVAKVRYLKGIKEALDKMATAKGDNLASVDHENVEVGQQTVRS